VSAGAATTPFQTPAVPEVSQRLPRDVIQLHSADYRNPNQLPPGRVLVVGAANSGLQIAAELAATRSVTVAVGSRPAQLPQRVLGRDLFFWLTRSAFLTVPSHSRIARRLRARGDLVIGSRTSTLRRRGIDFRPRLADSPAAPPPSPTEAPPKSTRSYGPPATAVTTRGCTCRLSSTAGRSGRRPASPTCPASASSGCPGRPPEARHCSGSSALTPPPSPLVWPPTPGTPLPRSPRQPHHADAIGAPKTRCATTAGDVRLPTASPCGCGATIARAAMEPPPRS
jgi:hypothetical protein